MPKKLFRLSPWRRLARAVRLDFRAFLVVVLGLVLAGLAWRFGLDRDEPPATVVASRPRTEVPDPVATDPLAVAPIDIQRALERVVRIGRPVRCGGGNRPVVALTFDDGPGPRTSRILRALGREGAGATFFLVGERVGRPDAPTIAQMGPSHAIGNHTWGHTSLRGMTKRQRRTEIVRARKALELAAESPVVLFRPPFGHRDGQLDRMLARMGLVQVLWSETVGDNRTTNSERIVLQVSREIRPGAIVLLHEKEPTVRALPAILDILAARGLTPVTVPELLAIDPPSGRQLRRGLCPPGVSQTGDGAQP